MAPTDPPPRHQAAAYDPASDSWRLLADPPASLGFVYQPAVAGGIVYLLGTPARARLASSATTRRPTGGPNRRRLQVTWVDWSAVGDQVVAYQGSHENGVAPDSVYDPDKDTWSALPASPLGSGFDRSMVALDDHRLVLLDLELVPNPGAERPSLYRAAVLDLTDRSWRRLPDSEVVGFDPDVAALRRALVNPATESFDGGEVGNWGRSYPAGGILDPDTGRWSALPATAPPQPQQQHVGTVAGDGVVVTGNAVLHVRDQSWADLPDLPALHDVVSRRDRVGRRPAVRLGRRAVRPGAPGRAAAVGRLDLAPGPGPHRRGRPHRRTDCDSVRGSTSYAGGRTAGSVRAEGLARRPAPQSPPPIGTPWPTRLPARAACSRPTAVPLATAAGCWSRSQRDPAGYSNSRLAATFCHRIPGRVRRHRPGPPRCQRHRDRAAGQGGMRAATTLGSCQRAPMR